MVIINIFFLLYANLGGKVNRHGARVHFLSPRMAVAVCIVGSAVELLAASAGTQGVVLVCKGVPVDSAELVCILRWSA